ncbi:MAG: hypothetical protein IK066_12640 [Kiritimatiellae bacterium]|nr:hypothetical protein [Kiritimatiellia bacterium]
MENGKWLAVAAGVAVMCAGVARGQWVTQEIPLKEGWNAVCVRVEPASGSLEAVAEGGGVEGVWRWDKRFTAAEYVVDEASPLSKDPHWKAWYPGEEIGFLSTLGEMSGWQCYLVKVKEGAGERTVAIKGKAKLPRVEWYPNALNLVGFPVGENGATFGEWFEAAKAVDLSKGFDNGAWQIAQDGNERVVSKPGLQKLSAGEAAWVHCNGASDYSGPLEVTAGSGEGLDFGAGLQKIGLSVENLSGTRARTVTLRLAASEAAPEGEEQVSGGVPLFLAEGDEWTAFSEKTVELGPGETWRGTFGVHRVAMEYRETLAETNSSYQSVLQVRDAEGKIAIDVPVRAVRESSAASGGESIHLLAAAPHGQTGLWTGTATLLEVNCPNYSTNTLLPVQHAATLRLIAHVDASGAVRLMNEAWAVPASTNGTAMKVYARREQVPAGAADVWRATSATLPPMAPLLLGTNGLSGTLSGTVKLAYDNPVNPFLHRYHPLFDNKDGQFKPYPGPVESRNVSRKITLLPAAPEGLEDSDQTVSGTYEEQLTGLRAQTIRVKGTFRLDKVLADAELETAKSGENSGE